MGRGDALTAAAPSGVVTFLFTDVEGSTSRWEKDANAMQAALAAHDEVLRLAIEVHGGFLFKHTGDGVCAAFASPRSAVDAAVAAQRALELPVRMGLRPGKPSCGVGISRRRALRSTRPRRRNHDQRRDGDLRTRPNRPGPSRTERRLEIDEI